VILYSLFAPSLSKPPDEGGARFSQNVNDDGLSISVTLRTTGSTWQSFSWQWQPVLPIMRLDQKKFLRLRPSPSL